MTLLTDAENVPLPLFRVFTIAVCNGFRISIGTVGGHLGDRLGAGVGRVGRGDGTMPRWIPRLGGEGDNAQSGEIRLVDERLGRHDEGGQE